MQHFGKFHKQGLKKTGMFTDTEVFVTTDVMLQTYTTTLSDPRIQQNDTDSALGKTSTVQFHKDLHDFGGV